MCLLKLHATEMHASTDSKLDVKKNTSMGNNLSWLTPQKGEWVHLRWLCQVGGGWGDSSNSSKTNYHITVPHAT